MTPIDYLALAVRPACTLLGPAFVDPRAEVLLVAIARQESGLGARRQLGGGPARGFAQFEEIAVVDVLTRARTKAHAKGLLHRLAYSAELPARAVHLALEHHDILAAGFARLNLFNSPRALPPVGDVEEGWREYVSVWRPGAVARDPAPHRARWDESYRVAMAALAVPTQRPTDTQRALALLDEARALLAGG